MLDGSLQKDVAQKLEVCGEAYLGWEHDRRKPPTRYLPKIIDFLGYDPFPEPKTLGERIKAKRRRIGLSQEQAAKHLSVDEGTLRRWERDEWRPTKRLRLGLDRWLNSPW